MPEPAVDLALEGKRLTPKERELLQLLGEGKTNQEIADALDLRLSTIKTLSHRLFIKLGVKNRLQAVIMNPRPLVQRPSGLTLSRLALPLLRATLIRRL